MRVFQLTMWQLAAMGRLGVLLWLLCCRQCYSMATGSAPARLRLLDVLQSNYTRAIRLQPKPTHIILDPALYGIVDVNEARESVVIAQWFELSWTDSLLEWDPADYDGVKVLRVLQSQIWVPDITIYQLLESSRQGGPDESFLTISYDGTVFMSRTEQITFSCAFDVSQFPNDRQNCTLTYVTWAYPSDEIVMTPAQAPKARDNYYRVSSEWHLVNYTCEMNKVDYGEDIGMWYEISYYIAIQRKPFYYIITLTVPSFFITNLALLGVFSPSTADQQRGEKVTIGLTALLTMAVILMMVSDLMPKNASSFPKLGMYILWEMLLLCVSTVMAVCLMYLHSCQPFDKPIPWPFRFVFFVGDRSWQGWRWGGAFCSTKMSQVSDVPNGCAGASGPASLDDVQHYSQSKYSYAKLSQMEGTAVGEKLATYSDDLLQAQGCPEQGSARVARRMMVVHRNILLKINELQELLKQKLATEEADKHTDTQWKVLMFRLDLVGMVLTVGANCVVTYWFSGSWSPEVEIDESRFQNL